MRNKKYRGGLIKFKLLYAFRSIVSQAGFRQTSRITSYCHSSLGFVHIQICGVVYSRAFGLEYSSSELLEFPVKVLALRHILVNLIEYRSMFPSRHTCISRRVPKQIQIMTA